MNGIVNTFKSKSKKALSLFLFVNVKPMDHLGQLSIECHRGFYQFGHCNVLDKKFVTFVQLVS